MSFTVKSMLYPTQWYCLWYYPSSELLFWYHTVLIKAYVERSTLSRGVFMHRRCQLIKTFVNKEERSYSLFLPNSMPFIINSVILSLLAVDDLRSIRLRWSSTTSNSVILPHNTPDSGSVVVMFIVTVRTVFQIEREECNIPYLWDMV